jgi:predicted methyltransferase
MRKLMILSVLLAALPLAASSVVSAAGVQAVPPAIAKAVADPRRKPANRARDGQRHPAETLAFFGLRPEMTVVEIWPMAGWYTEILAPALRDKGKLIGAAQADGRYREATNALVASDPARFGKVLLTDFEPARGPSTIAAPGSADMVLTFRNIHNFLMAGDAAAAQAFADMYAALKPGGVLGIVDHRLPEDRPGDAERKTGYIKRSTVLRLATAAGFRLAGESEVNANPKDKAEWPGGVWSLPPTLSQGDKDRATYLAVGESDRLTMKFVKPKA